VRTELLTDILHLAVSTAAIQTIPAYAGYKASDFRLVRVGGLGLYSPRILLERAWCKMWV